METTTRQIRSVSVTKYSYNRHHCGIFPHRQPVTVGQNGNCNISRQAFGGFVFERLGRDWDGTQTLPCIVFVCIRQLQQWPQVVFAFHEIRNVCHVPIGPVPGLLFRISLSTVVSIMCIVPMLQAACQHSFK